MALPDTVSVPRRGPSDARSAAWLMGPAYLWLIITVLLPLAAMFYFSFLSDVPIAGRNWYTTFSNYEAFFQQEFYRTLMWRSLRLGAEVALWCFVIGFPCAYVLAKTIKGRWREALFLLVIIPFWSNALIRIFSWTMVLRGNGILERFLAWLIPGFGSLDLMFTYPAVVIGLVHSYLPYMILTCYISLQTIDDSLVDAARSLGASRLTVLRKVILPLAMPGIVAGAVLIFVPVIGSFMEPRILGGREGTFLGTVIEDQFTAVFNWPLGAALSFLLLACVLIIFAVFQPILRRAS
ncbi:ABC transporter permease [Halomonas salipaludis]|uniref:Peptide ABC transporter permease n=1 Tax=Halomonas salipaludis TaxID=2032625 RepID=A0A2A2ERK2_9GAMM|nr:ABC transporter permease [Halomonas salipaludis]PAU75170.1 peptide ABC transporter permease [Halomonas salipaludis]